MVYDPLWQIQYLKVEKAYFNCGIKVLNQTNRALQNATFH